MQPDVSTARADLDLARTVEELKRELAEAHRRETATAEVLRIISRSTFDLQTVLDGLIESAVRLTGAELGLILRQDGEVYRPVTFYGASSEFMEVTRQNPIPPGRGSATGRAIIERRVVHIHDVLADPEYTWWPHRQAEIRTVLAVPMLRSDSVNGVIVMRRTRVQPFTEQQISLLETFAAQAVIAIENVRLFKELRESLQQQTATADVLKVISRSTFDLQGVLDTLVESAARLCEADIVNIWRPDGAGYRLAASYAVPGKFKEALANKSYLESLFHEPGRGSIVGRTLLERRTVQVHDVQADPDYDVGGILALGASRTALGIPLLREGVPIGVLFLTRTRVEPFTQPQISLLETFADQAVIAIENVRLFEEVQARTRELQESLEYQTATANVLGVISRSPNELQPVLDAIAKTAFGLCPSNRALIMLRDPDGYRVVARAGSAPEIIKERMGQGPLAVDRSSVFGRVVLEGRTIHVGDVRSDPDYALMPNLLVDDRRTILGVPLMREGVTAGVIILIRTKVEPYTRRQIELIETFADQAVIAMNNAQLFEQVQARTRELSESLEYQTATAAVLNVISRSPTNAQPV
jgi:GAF domain-containing protein